MLRLVIFILLAIAVGRVFFVVMTRERGVEPEWIVLGVPSEKAMKIRGIQTVLKSGGFYHGTPDGVLGEGTRKALKKFQRKNRIRPSGLVDRKTLDAIDRWKEARTKADPGLWEDGRVSADIPTERGAGSIWALERAEKVRQIQTAMLKAGYFKGKIDGKNGPRTRRAIKAFQKDHGLSPDGVAGVKTLRVLEKFLPIHSGTSVPRNKKGSL